MLLCPVVIDTCTATNASSVSPCCGSVSFIQSGEIEIVNHKSKDKCQLKFTPYSYFSRDVPRKVSIQQGLCSCRGHTWLFQARSGAEGLARHL